MVLSFDLLLDQILNKQTRHWLILFRTAWLFSPVGYGCWRGHGGLVGPIMTSKSTLNTCHAHLIRSPVNFVAKLYVRIECSVCWHVLFELVLLQIKIEVVGRGEVCVNRWRAWFQATEQGLSSLCVNANLFLDLSFFCLRISHRRFHLRLRFQLAYGCHWVLEVFLEDRGWQKLPIPFLRLGQLQLKPFTNIDLSLLALTLWNFDACRIGHNSSDYFVLESCVIRFLQLNAGLCLLQISVFVRWHWRRAGFVALISVGSNERGYWCPLKGQFLILVDLWRYLVFLHQRYFYYFLWSKFRSVIITLLFLIFGLDLSE